MTILFEDDFETGDFSKWNGTIGNATVIATEPFEGIRHATFQLPGTISGEYAFALKNLSPSQAILYARGYFKFKGSNPVSGRDAKIMFRGALGQEVFELMINGNPVRWSLAYLDGGVLKYITAPTGPILDQYYSVELYGKVGITDGEAALYIDGQLVLSVTGINSSAQGNITQVRMGQMYVAAPYPHSVYLDSVIMADAYIGPFPVPKHLLSIDSTPTGIPFTLNGASQITPYQNSLNEGSYTIIMPPTMQIGADYYGFKYWQDDPTNTNPTRTINLTIATTLVAYYELAPPPPEYTLTIDITPIGGGTTNPAPGLYVYVQGQQPQVSAIASSGYAFDHWGLQPDNLTSTANPWLLPPMNTNKTLTAYFVAGPPSQSRLQIVGRDIMDIQLGRNVILKTVQKHAYEDSAGGLWWDEVTPWQANNFTEFSVKRNLDVMKQWGANGLRIIFRVRFWLDNTPDINGIPFRTQMKQLAQWANERNMYVVLCGFSLEDAAGYHGIPWGTSTFPTLQDFINFWMSIATELMPYPNVLLELWNEQVANKEEWFNGCQQVIAAIRAITDHIVVFQWNWDVWVRDGDFAAVETIEWAADPRLSAQNILISTHMYQEARGYYRSAGVDTYYYSRADIENVFIREKLLDMQNGTGAFAATGPKALWVGEFAPSYMVPVPPNEEQAVENALTILDEWGINYNLMWWYVPGQNYVPGTKITGNFPYGLWTSVDSYTQFTPTEPWGIIAKTHLLGIALPLAANVNGPYSANVSNPTIAFKGTAFGGTPPYSWLWDFGDGTTSIEQNPTHTYAGVEAIYTIRLTVTDSLGASYTDTATAAVAPPIPAAICPTAVIATCVYGSSVDLNIIRSFRDDFMSRTKIGRWLSRTYYKLGKPIAKWLEPRERVKRFLKAYLDLLVWTLKNRGFRSES